MTSTLVAQQRVSAGGRQEELPETTAGWAEIDTGAGFSTADRVDLAASWFDPKAEANMWHTGDGLLVRSDGPDGRVWVDPDTGEISGQVRPQSELVARHRLTSARVVMWHNPATGEHVWVEPDTYVPVDRECVTVTLNDEKQSCPLDYQFTITPGTLKVTVTDPRNEAADPTTVPRWNFDADGNKVLADGETPVANGAARSAITEFSRRSRKGLIERVLSIPWADYLNPGERIWFVTLTAPSDWERWLGNHDQAERAMKRFTARLAHHTNAPARFIWKREFQGRGAPHWHLILIAPPQINGTSFRHWLSEQWYQAVGSGETAHRNAGTNVDIKASVRAVDPKRLALYFAGYSTNKNKDYQHDIPDGYESPDTGTTGRWWGAKGLPKKEATVRVTKDDVAEIQRLLRAREASQRGSINPTNEALQGDPDQLPERLKRAQAKKEKWESRGHQARPDGTYNTPLTKSAVVRRWTFRKLGGAERTHEGPPEPVYRNVRRRQRLKTLNGTDRGCTVYTNDAPALAVNIARHLNQQQTGTPATDMPIGHRGGAQERIDAASGRKETSQ